MKDWTLVQIEGETPTVAVVEEVKDPKKKAPPPSKDVKKAQAGQLEEITDNRPRIITWTKNF